MNNILKEAIADAKAVRESALANAKLALEETFAPKLQSMLSTKLSEEFADDDEYADDVPVEEADDASVEDAPEFDDVPVEEAADEFTGDEPVDDAPEDNASMDDAELDEILRELDETEPTEDEPVEEAPAEEAPAEDDINLDELFNLSEEDESFEDDAPAEDTVTELKEAYKVIGFLRSKINEVNILNAKLLFSNKLFRNYDLSEGQKIKVIENFDRAANLREVKLIYATLSESFKSKTSKKTIKESKSSNGTRSTAPAKAILSEGQEMVDRWKYLAFRK